MRLDKLLSEMGADSRSEIKKSIRKGLVSIDGQIIKDSSYNADETSVVCYKNKEYLYKRHQYFMLNKPAGLLSATMDKKQPTVIDLFADTGRKDLFPVGRLDKDTVGLLIITNDGELAHRLLSPNKHVPKTYFARVDKKLCEDDVKAFREGIIIEEDFVAMPANLVVEDDAYSARVTVYEGKFHQVKRMFEALGKEVVYLKRESMGKLVLDETLKEGEFRELSEDEKILLEVQKE